MPKKLHHWWLSPVVDSLGASVRINEIYCKKLYYHCTGYEILFGSISQIIVATFVRIFYISVIRRTHKVLITVDFDLGAKFHECCELNGCNVHKVMAALEYRALLRSNGLFFGMHRQP